MKVHFPDTLYFFCYRIEKNLSYGETIFEFCEKIQVETSKSNAQQDKNANFPSSRGSGPRLRKHGRFFG